MNLLQLPPDLSEEEFKSMELIFPSEGIENSDNMMEFETITNTALIPESISNAYGVKISSLR